MEVSGTGYLIQARSESPRETLALWIALGYSCGFQQLQVDPCDDDGDLSYCKTLQRETRSGMQYDGVKSILECWNDLEAIIVTEWFLLYVS